MQDLRYTHDSLKIEDDVDESGAILSTQYSLPQL